MAWPLTYWPCHDFLPRHSPAPSPLSLVEWAVAINIGNDAAEETVSCRRRLRRCHTGAAGAVSGRSPNGDISPAELIFRCLWCWLWSGGRLNMLYGLYIRYESFSDGEWTVSPSLLWFSFSRLEIICRLFWPYVGEFLWFLTFGALAL